MEKNSGKFVDYRGFTFDDVLLVPGYSEVVPSGVNVDEADAADRPQYPDMQRGYGHGHGGPPRDSARARGRHRNTAQEPSA